MKITNPLTYNLPHDKIATRPPQNREDAKMLFCDGESIHHKTIKDLPLLLPKNSLIIINNTKVIKARLVFQNSTGKKIEVFLTPPHNSWDEIKIKPSPVNTHCLIGNKSNWKDGETISISKDKTALEAINHEDSTNVTFKWNTNQTFEEILIEFGHVPIPPYMKRPDEESDEERYQTAFAKKEGSVAAPTASLHFTENSFKEIIANGHKILEVTLHVGLGTFLPIKTEIDNHKMHSEFFQIPKQTIKNLKSHQGPVIAFGTTATRTLESIPYIADEIIKTGKFDGFIKQENTNQEKPLPKEKYLEIILEYLEKSDLEEISGETAIFITPGFNWTVVDGMVTNFHEPKSTLLCLVASFIGPIWETIYQEALNKNYRFLSYGDTSFLLKKK